MIVNINKTTCGKQSVYEEFKFLKCCGKNSLASAMHDNTQFCLPIPMQYIMHVGKAIDI